MSAVPKPKEQLRMMIVDDSNVMRRRIERSQQNDRLEVVGTEMNGIECVEHVIKIKPDVLILVVSALADKATAVEAIEKGANGFLCKPFTDDQLNEALAELIGE